MKNVLEIIKNLLGWQPVHFEIIEQGSVAGILVGEDLHIVDRKSASSWWFNIAGQHYGYYCTCRCGRCDRSVRQDVYLLAPIAKVRGAKKLYFRYPCEKEIGGLPVYEIGKHQAANVRAWKRIRTFEKTL